MPHLERKILIILIFSICFSLFSNIENDYKEALRVADENSENSVDICSRISDASKLEFFARNSKNPKLITQALRYLSFKGEKGVDFKIIADSLVNSDPSNDLLLKEFARNNIPIRNQEAVIRLYKIEKNSIYAKQIHDQNAIIGFLKDEKSLGMRHTFLRNLTDESTLEKYALEADDWGTKEIVYWRLNDSLFISKLINKEENEKYKEILRTRLDMLDTSGKLDWFVKLCDRQIEKFKPNKDITLLTKEELVIREFLIYYFSSDVYKVKLKLLSSMDKFKSNSHFLKEVIPELVPYITIQDTIKYAIDDRINDDNSKMGMHKINQNNVKSLSVFNLNFQIVSLETIYFDNKFREVLISLSNNSTIADSELCFNNINVKRIESKNVITYPVIKMIFNSDFTKVMIDLNSGDQGEFKNFKRSWIPDGGGGSWIY
jgi:hypothetical protein